MIQRKLTLEHPLRLHDVKKVVERIKDIGENEELVIQMNSQDSFRAESIFSILGEGDYKWVAKGGHDGSDYYIVAKKR